MNNYDRAQQLRGKMVQNKNNINNDFINKLTCDNNLKINLSVALDAIYYHSKSKHMDKYLKMLYETIFDENDKEMYVGILDGTNKLINNVRKLHKLNNEFIQIYNIISQDNEWKYMADYHY